MCDISSENGDSVTRLDIDWIGGEPSRTRLGQGLQSRNILFLEEHFNTRWCNLQSKSHLKVSMALVKDVTKSAGNVLNV